MNTKSLFVSVLLGMTVLAGCNQGHAPASDAATVQRNWLSIPALPIIEDAVFSLSPKFKGQRNPQVMTQVCGLARGELTQEQVNTFLDRQNVDAAKLPRQGHPLSLLVSGDKSAQTTACAAYLATAVLSTVDIGEFAQTVEAPATDKADKKAADKPALQLDSARLNASLPIKLAEARANADVFALIAAELQRRPGLTAREYREEARQLFSKLAPAYLERVKLQLPKDASYKLERMSAEHFTFSNSHGAVFDFGGEGLTLRQNNVVWYGQGKLLGMDYPLQVAYFPDTVNELLAPAGK
ncbi:hypothetical protein [Pseudomonas schmalbachii]|uniref:Lipoprotein n=1 Tax=Pseudomonas schmalbachii TaxID=2816993 RepID=A0ABS3TQR5_9PSED|nr:hypothetical protein [Pseudomonas schmalbachii]MBO3275488.1 hypothetical protein [Pseudomonas schmalbachii]